MNKEFSFFWHNVRKEILSINILSTIYIIIPAVFILTMAKVNAVEPGQYNDMLPILILVAILAIAILRPITALRKTRNIDMSRKLYLLVSNKTIVVTKVLIEFIFFSITYLIIAIFALLIGINETPSNNPNEYATGDFISLFLVYLNFSLLYILLFTISLLLVSYSKGSLLGRFFAIFLMNIVILALVVLFMVASNLAGNPIFKFIENYPVLVSVIPGLNLLIIFMSLVPSWTNYWFSFIPTLYMLTTFLGLLLFVLPSPYEKYQIDIY